MADIKVGSVVILKSGGPLMTVEIVTGGVLTCVWFDGSNLMRENIKSELVDLQEG